MCLLIIGHDRRHLGYHRRRSLRLGYRHQRSHHLGCCRQRSYCRLRSCCFDCYRWRNYCSGCFHAR